LFYSPDDLPLSTGPEAGLLCVACLVSALLIAHPATTFLALISVKTSAHRPETLLAQIKSARSYTNGFAKRQPKTDNLLIRLETGTGWAELYAHEREQGWLKTGRITPAVAVVEWGYVAVSRQLFSSFFLGKFWNYTNAG